MVLQTSPPPLSPMSKETTPMKQAPPEARSLGSALAALGTSRKASKICLEEPIEEGIGSVGHMQDAEDEVLSVQQQHEPSQQERRPKQKRASFLLPDDHHAPRRSQPKRGSLLERSKQFQDKLVKFMSDYSNYNDDVEDVDMMATSNISESGNNFPTRERDLRHVDQKINLMDASSKRHDNFYDDYEDYDEAAYYDEEEDDVYANYTEGYSAAGGHDSNSSQMQRQPSIPPRKDLEKTWSYSHHPVKKEPSFWERNFYCIRWTLVILLCLLAATWLLISLNFFVPSSTSVGYASSSNTPAASPHAAGSSGGDPRTNPGEVYTRKHDLQGVLQTKLLPEAHEDADLMNLRSPHAVKTVTWMTTYDKKSMRLLDQYHGKIGQGDHNHPQEESDSKEYENGKERVSVKENRDDPNHHLKSKIVDRYVEGLYYFKEHPDCAPDSANV